MIFDRPRQENRHLESALKVGEQLSEGSTVGVGTGTEWEFAVLGPLEVRHRGEIIPIPAERQRTLLATLLLQGNEPVAIRDLVDRIWSDNSPMRSSAAVHSLVMRLRRTLSRDGHGDGLIRTLAQSYALEVPADAVDLTRFDSLRSQARDANLAGDQGRRADLLRKALTLWRGDPLADITSDVLQLQEVPALAERWIQTCEEYVDAELELGRHQGVVGMLQEGIARHPLREGLWARLMVALFHSGRQAEALDAYRKLSAMLAEELGLDPSPAVQQLQLAILKSELPHPASPTTGPTVQVADPWHQLPADPGALYGRAEQIKAVIDLIGDRTGNDRLPVVCLSGPPGVGKTAFAVHVAHQLRSRFPDGQWYVRLRSRQTGDRDVSDVLSELLHHAGIRGAALPSGLDGRTNALRAALADRRVLLLLDDAASAEQVAPLLPGNAACAVLVTSRTKLGGLVAMHGGRAINLDTLSPNDAADLLMAAFAEHRIDVGPGLAVELARLCGYLPLALRIAAANIAMNAPQPPAEYLRQLRDTDRLSALAVEGNAQVGIRAALEPSYHDLSTHARRALRMLAICPIDDFTVHDIAAVIGRAPAEAASVLRQLNTANLVRPTCSTRFELHDLVRLYASERSQAEDSESDRESALQWLFESYLVATDAAARSRYSRMLFLAAPKIEGDAPPIDAESWFQAEYRNLLAAVQHCAQHGPSELTWQLADRIRGYQQAIGAHADWRLTSELGLDLAQRQQSDTGEAAMQLSLATLSASRADYADARRRFQLSLAIYSRLGDPAGQGAVSNNLGIVHREEGHLADARGSYFRALQFYRKAGLERAKLTCLGNLGVVQMELDQLADAVESQSEALAGCRALNASDLDDDVATALHNLAVATRAQGRCASAVMLLTRALAIHRHAGSLYGQANDIDSLAACYVDLGYYAKAMQLGDECLVLARRIGRRRLESEALNTRARAYLGLGDTLAAIAAHQAALALSQSLGYRRAEIEALTGLALAHRANGQYIEARQRLEEAERIALASQHYLLARHARDSARAAELSHE